MHFIRILLTACLLSLSLNLTAQDSTDDLVKTTSEESATIIEDTLRGWDYSWVGGLNGSQASYSNWSQGGVNTISVTASTVFNLRYRKERFAYRLISNFKYGKAKIEDEGTRKTDDKISISNKFSYLFPDDRFNVFGILNFNTQFDEGFDYDVPDGADPILISDFFAPAYFTQVVGVGYVPAPSFSAEAGFALKETIVNNTALSTRYGLDPGENFRFEPGFSFIFNYEQNVVSNIKLISSLETFTNLGNSLSSTDINFSNELIGSINDFVNTSLQFVLVFDDDFSEEVQVKQVLSVGVSFSIL